MIEILPNLFHYTATHEKICLEVSSYYLADAGVLIDPMTPEAGISWFREHGPPKAVLLTNRHHYRHSGEYVDAFGCTVHCHSSGLHEFVKGEQVEPFEFGDRLTGGVIAQAVDAICPDETALYVPQQRMMAFADGLVQVEKGGPLSFVPGRYMDDPPKVKRGLIAAFEKLLELDFEHVLMAHGDPLIGDGKTQLAEFVERTRRLS